MMKWTVNDERFAQVSFVGALVIVLLVVFQFITGSHMLAPTNLQNIVMANAHIAVLAIGMILVVTVGQLDLSVGSTAAFSSMCVALVLAASGAPWWIGLILGLSIGALVGAAQGFIVARFKLPAFIVTVAGMIILRGGVQWGSAALSVPVPSEFTVLGAGFLPSIGNIAGIDLATVAVGAVCAALTVSRIFTSRIRRRRHGLEESTALPWLASAAAIVGIGILTFLFASGRPGTSFPVPGVVVLVLVAVYHVVSTRTAFGRHVRAIGGNARAAALSGVNVPKVQILVMANMGLLAALAGMMFAGRSTAAGPLDGQLWELDAIAAVFIGGAAVAGGRGSILGAVLGAALMAVLSNGLLLVGIGSAPAAVVKGLVLLAAVVLDAEGRRRADTGSEPKPSFTA
ncbi:ABC transporter permease subunit [Schaalia hyovaginalis]|uniref:ABC transporter permease subunit n=1 Tax=Schaalia hyovaginalis TaxID=29316 RepID=UPI0012B1F311|nr:sugar ABC transporter permease [Schaalia hyovaginalis]MST64267.1 sugar ABC transporter permease [Schaalia hyovaginalis]